ncbi:MAG: hypothetical protein D4R67_05250 [Bacteroidetes bacterium]|nr:MAG: hypothetical protein D4R67_05250 [Bacteroidota bacterium]
MQTTRKKSKWIATGAGILFVLALILSGIFFFQNRKLNDSVIQEQSKGITLLAQKHALQQEVGNLTETLTGMKGKNRELDAQLTQAISKLTVAQSELNRLMRENKDRKAIEEKLREIQALKDELSAQVVTLTEKLDNLTQENIALNNTVFGLQGENRELTANIQMMQAVLANNFLIEAMKGKMDKPTVVARRTSKLKADFDIPINIQVQVHFKIIKPNGAMVDSRTDKNFTLKTLGLSTELLAGSSSLTGAPIKTKRYSVIYKPEAKLRPGIYTIEVYNNDTYLGASQIKLR